MSASFSSGLCDCCSDMPICCFGLSQTPCLVGDTYSRVTGEGGCGTCCCYWLLSSVCLCGISGCKVRRELRSKFGIEKSTGDFCVHCFCSPCAACQEAREIKSRMKVQFGVAVAPAYQPPPTY